jgi:hypothetical protein
MRNIISLSPIFLYALPSILVLAVLAFVAYMIARYVRRRKIAQALHDYERELIHAFDTPVVTERSIVELSWMRNRLKLSSKMVAPLHQRSMVNWEATFVTADSVTGEELEIARRLRRELKIEEPYGEGYGRFY